MYEKGKMMQELLSVVIPVYNNKEYLGQCVESIFNQQYKELEIILIDDGSSDGSGALCDELALKDKRIRVVHKSNGGAISARKCGCLEASAEYITFVDSDDWIDEDMYAYLMKELTQNSVDIITSGFLYTNGESCDGFAEKVYSQPELSQYIIPNMIYNVQEHTSGIIGSVCNKIFRKKLIQNALEGMDESIRQWEDIAYLYLACYRAAGIQVTHRCFYHYRENVKSVTKQYDPAYFEKTEYSFTFIKKYFRQNQADVLLSQLVYEELWGIVNGIQMELNRSLLDYVNSKKKCLDVVHSNTYQKLRNQLDMTQMHMDENIKKELIFLENDQYWKARIVKNIYDIKKVYWSMRDIVRK